MIADLKPYPKTQDSGVPCLGEVPEHWALRRLRDTIQGCFNGVWGGEPNQRDDLVCIRVADFDRTRRRVNATRTTIRAIDPRLRNLRLLRRGDLLIEKSGGGEQQPVGTVVLYDHDVAAVCSNFVARMPPSTGFDPRYLVYVHEYLYAIRLNVRSIKQTTGIQNLDLSAYLNEQFAFPPLSEQVVAAYFLDHAGRRIRRYIRAKQKLIMLLEEQRRAIIHRAVTRGLDPFAHFVPSGLDWIEQLPAHWHIVRASSVCKLVSAKAHEQFVEPNGEHICVTARFVSTDGRDFRRCTENFSPARRGDVLMVMSDLPRGRALARAYLVNDDRSYAVNQRVCMLRPTRINPSFLALVANRHPELLARDDGSNQTHLPNAAFKVMRLPLPPLGEQEEIVGFVECATKELDILIGRARDEIHLLGEYLTRLIADVVTGKLDVGEAAARLPAELEPWDEDADQELEEAEGDLNAELEEVEA